MEEVRSIVSTLLGVLGPESIEIEARVRGPIVSAASVARLINKLCVFTETTYTERKKISKTNRKCVYRYRYDDYGLSEVVCKSSLLRADLLDAWCTVHVSTEVSMPSAVSTLSFVEDVTVTRFRGSFHGHWIDITERALLRGTALSVEVEAQDAAALDTNGMMSTVLAVCAVMQDSPQAVGRLDWMTLKHITAASFGRFCLAAGKYQKPVTTTNIDVYRIVRDNSLRNSPWLVTPKVDGVRRFVIVIGDATFSVDMMGDARYLGSSRDTEDITILDCEYLDDVHHVIDVVVYNGVYVGARSMDERLDIVELVQEYGMRAKAYAGFRSFRELRNIYNQCARDESTDGMIFINRNKGYMQRALKWKPENTVDLEVVYDLGRCYLQTCDGHLVDTLFSDLFNGIKLERGIWEFKNSSGILVPTRARPDKPQANSLEIVRKNVTESAPGNVFEGIGCYFMRKYHNAVKRAMIMSMPNTNILDIGTGQGGDVTKWAKAKTVYCVEPDSESTAEMIKRHGTKDSILVNNCFLRDLDPKHVGNKNISLFTAFFCINQWEDSDWDGLERAVTALGTRRCKLMVIALTHPYEEDNRCWKLYKEEPYYYISIHSTRIVGIREKAMSIDRLDSLMARCRMTRTLTERLNMCEMMTEEEQRLSAMYTAIVYQRGKAPLSGSSARIDRCIFIDGF